MPVVSRWLSVISETKAALWKLLGGSPTEAHAPDANARTSETAGINALPFWGRKYCDLLGPNVLFISRFVLTFCSQYYHSLFDSL
jgi:hypothetical protein